MKNVEQIVLLNTTWRAMLVVLILMITDAFVYLFRKELNAQSGREPSSNSEESVGPKTTNDLVSEQVAAQLLTLESLKELPSVLTKFTEILEQMRPATTDESVGGEFNQEQMDMDDHTNADNGLLAAGNYFYCQLDYFSPVWVKGHKLIAVYSLLKTALLGDKTESQIIENEQGTESNFDYVNSILECTKAEQEFAIPLKEEVAQSFNRIPTQNLKKENIVYIHFASWDLT